MIKTLTLLILILFIISFEGCYTHRAYSEAIINENADWVMIKECGYEGCDPMVDVLRRDDIKIRIEAFNGILVKNVFTIKLIFFIKEKDIYKFDPSLVYVTLQDGQKIKAKALPCEGTIHNLGYLREASPLNGVILIDKWYENINEFTKCIDLFFDGTPPSVDDKFTLYLNGVTKEGQPVKIPEIIFRKGIH